MKLTVYGIKSCQSMKKTFDTLEALDVAYDFHDYKKQGIDTDTVTHWVNRLGIDKVLNKRGTTWRKLTDEQKQAADTDISTAIDLMVANTSMIKRPIIAGSHHDTAVLLCGYDEKSIAQALSTQ